MSEFSGSWKHQNNPEPADSVRVFIMLKLDNYMEVKTEGRWLELLPFLTEFTL